MRTNKKTNKKRKIKKKQQTKKVYKKNEYLSGDGMLTTVWGPSAWHFLHTISFNYPNKPTNQQKRQYKNFIIGLQHILPCGHCRKNLTNNLKAFPLKTSHLKNRDSFSRYIYQLHETINKMLGKKSGLSFCQVRERYEHFRARCTEENTKIFKFNKTKKKREKGCTEPLYGKKAKCILKIVPQEKKCSTMEIDKQCIKRRI